LSTPAHARLAIYTLLGQEVAVLVNEKKSAGTWTALWNAAGFPSGVYFYQLQLGNSIQAKKMVLLK
jgi:hypothetical protein